MYVTNLCNFLSFVISSLPTDKENEEKDHLSTTVNAASKATSVSKAKTEMDEAESDKKSEGGAVGGCVENTGNEGEGDTGHKENSEEISESVAANIPMGT